MNINSWYRKKYPQHQCQECNLTHHTIPPIHVPQTIQDTIELVEMRPQEAVGVMLTKDVHLGVNTPLDTPAQVLELFWGTPGTREIEYQSSIFLN